MEKRIDLRDKKYLMFIDTETIGSLYLIESVLPFEIGMKIYDNITKKVVYEKSYIVRKLFNNKYTMLSSFSGNKYPTYKNFIENDNRYKLMSVKEISTDLKKVIKRYNIDTMVAHNGKFDKQAIARLFNEFGIENPMKKIDLLDTMEISKVITYSRDYTNYCLANRKCLNSQKESNFISNSGRVRTTAQAIYSYLINDTNFEEKHTGLEDIDIELAIYQKSMELLGNTIVKVNTSPTWKDYGVVLEK